MNPDDLLFSIVIPAYNAGEWLGLTLESWAAQTFRSFEVIVVDDGSTDGTAEIAEAFLGRMNLRVIRGSHSGAPARPCNIGIKAARGSVIVHCDADDLATPDRLAEIERAWSLVQRRDCLLMSNFSEIDGAGATIRTDVLGKYAALQRAPKMTVGHGVFLIEPAHAFGAMLEGGFVRPCAAAVPKHVIEKIGGFNETLRNGQDFDLFVRIAREFPLIWSQRTLAQYRITPGSIGTRSAVELAPSKLAIFRSLLTTSLTVEQRHSVRGWIVANHEALGYDNGVRGNVGASLENYWCAFRIKPRYAQLRGAAVTILKSILRTTRYS